MVKWRNNRNRKLLEIERKRERELMNKYLFGVPALTKKKNGVFFLLLTMGPGFLICVLPVLRGSFPFLQDKSSLLLIIFFIGTFSGLLARGFLKKLSSGWSDVLSNFMKQKPETLHMPFNFQKIFEENHTWVIATYFFTFWIVFSGAVNIDYNSLVFTLSRSSKNSIIPLAGFVFFGFLWGFVNLWMILKIECIFSSVD